MATFEPRCCPLCDEASHFLPVYKIGPDTGRAFGKRMGASTKRSQWTICGTCGFVFQNPGLPKQAAHQVYQDSGYHPSQDMPDARGYERFAHWYFDEKINYLLKYARRNNGRVTEIGCGRGEASYVFQKRGFDIQSFEMDAGCVAIAQHFLGEDHVHRQLLEGNTQVLEKSDLVFSNHVFEHISDLNAALKGLQQVVKPGGYVFTAVPTPTKNRSFLGRAYMNFTHDYVFSHNALNHLFAKHGFKPVTHTYRGWDKEIDEVWHIAQYTGTPETNLSQYYENPKVVYRELNFWLPIRALLLSPLYAQHAKRIQIKNRLSHWMGAFLRSPGGFCRRVWHKLAGQQT